jgi:hypothetical protein
MKSSVTADTLRAALASRQHASSGDDDRAVEALTIALEGIGWHGADTVSAEEVAELLLPAIDACAHRDHDVATLYREVAEVLRGAGPLLDGGLPPVSAYLPAAEEVIRRFVSPSHDES